MWNLLPPEVKKEVDREYRYRFFTACLMLMCFSIVINIAVALPFAFSSYSSAAAADQKIKDYKKTDIGTTTNPTLETFGIFNQELDLLKPRTTLVDQEFTILIRAIVSEKPGGVKINSFSDTLDEKGKRIINISGVADSRDDLLVFSNNLIADKRFSKVDLPVSNFSKKTDIEYSVTLTILN